MRTKSEYEKFQDQIFDEIDKLKRSGDAETVRKLVEAAEIRGFSIPDMERMLRSGMSIAEFVKKVLGGSNPYLGNKLLE